MRVFALLMLALIVGVAERQAGAQEPQPVEVVVTNPGDAPEAACPDAEQCTLRAAILLVNADEGSGPFVIRFDAEVFGGDAPPAAVVLETPLPALARDGVTLTGEGATVVLDGAALDGGFDGLVMSGASARVEGIGVRGFGGACVVASGAGARLDGISVGGCARGIVLGGANGTVTKSRIGVDGGGGMTTGITVHGQAATIGSAIDAADGNTIGNVATGIVVGGSGSIANGAVIANNTIGRDGEWPVPVAIGVQIQAGGSGSRVTTNAFANTTLAAIQVPTGQGVADRNLFHNNRFAAIQGMAIDLGADGIRNPNDSDDGDDGPNRMQNHPVITRPTQASIAGEVPGCGEGCTVELYEVSHTPGGVEDFPTVPVWTAVTDAGGRFAFDAPPLVPGQWVMATATDRDGNTSEFGPSVRVGTGIVQCGNVTLGPGWTLAGYFGAGPLALNDVFPGASGRAVRAIYQLVNGTETYRHWFAGGAIGQTLMTLDPGEAYWFLVDAEVNLPEGFSLGVGLPVTLQAGWSSFVYIGGAGAIEDALATIEGRYGAVYAWQNDGEAAGWNRYVAGAPEWVNSLDSVESCGSYVVLMEEAGIMTPLQP